MFQSKFEALGAAGLSEILFGKWPGGSPVRNRRKEMPANSEVQGGRMDWLILGLMSTAILLTVAVTVADGRPYLSHVRVQKAADDWIAKRCGSNPRCKAGSASCTRVGNRPASFYCEFFTNFPDPGSAPPNESGKDCNYTLKWYLKGNSERLRRHGYPPGSPNGLACQFYPD
jgi:hypothetical protein